MYLRQPILYYSICHRVHYGNSKGQYLKVSGDFIHINKFCQMLNCKILKMN